MTTTLLQAWVGVALSGIALLNAAALVAQEPAPEKKPIVATGDSGTASAAQYDGWKVYHSYCDRCHGQDVTGSSFAPNLRQSVGANGMSESAFASVVQDGRADKGMPAFKATISEAQTGQLYAYVQARSSGALGPGRPKRAS